MGSGPASALAPQVQRPHELVANAAGYLAGEAASNQRSPSPSRSLSPPARSWTSSRPAGSYFAGTAHERLDRPAGRPERRLRLGRDRQPGHLRARRHRPQRRRLRLPDSWGMGYLIAPADGTYLLIHVNNGGWLQTKDSSGGLATVISATAFACDGDGNLRSERRARGTTTRISRARFATPSTSPARSPRCSRPTTGRTRPPSSTACNASRPSGRRPYSADVRGQCPRHDRRARQGQERRELRGLGRAPLRPRSCGERVIERNKQEASPELEQEFSQLPRSASPTGRITRNHAPS